MTEFRDLEAEVSAFVAHLTDTIDGTLMESHEFETKVGPVRENQRITVDQADEDGIPITVDGQLMFRLRVRFRCIWNSGQHFFAVNRSAFILSIEGVAEPLMHFDYDRDSADDIPVSHLNIHAHRDELMYALMSARGFRAGDRANAMKRGRIPRVSALHVPLGGHRFRPSLEDVLDMLVVEFGIDHRADARIVLAAGRARFRSIQVSAAVSDDPEMAADALRRLGYEVRAPNPLPARKSSRLARL